MDQALAKQLFLNGATIVILDMPEQSEFGIDYNSWTTGPKFRGIKMIPPGVHFMYFNATGKHGGRAARMGFFRAFKEREVIVRKWNALSEDLSEDIEGEEKQRYAGNLMELDQFLGPYPYENYKKWYSLVNEIEDDDVARLEPLNKKITSQSELITKETDVAGCSTQRVDREHPIRQRFQDEEGLPIMRVKPGTEIRFTEVPAAKSDESLTKLLASFDKPERMLAELQFAFVCFLMGHMYDGFEQWKRLVHLFCSCQKSLVTYETLYTKLLMVLFFQLKECPSDFFVDIVSRNNFLTITLSNLFSGIESVSGVSPTLQLKAQKFKAYLKKQFSWDFESEPDDFQPVIVE